MHDTGEIIMCILDIIFISFCYWYYKKINIVIGKVHQIYTDVTSDDIARYVRQIMAEDEYHRMKPTEVAKEVVAIITGGPTRKKRRPSAKAPASKNICNYISNA